MTERHSSRQLRRTDGRRLRAAVAVAALVLGALAVGVGALPRVPAATARADEVTASQDPLRDGWDRNEPGLSPAIVGGPSFGQLFSTAVNGQVYAQPVIAGSTVIVATENDYVYGLNAVTGAVQWSDSLGPPMPSTAQASCGDLTPDNGATSAPVYDPSTGTVYLVATVNDGPTVSQPHYYLYAMSAQTGTIQWQVPIQGAPVNEPTRPFNPFTERQRAGLLLMNGSVYMSFGSYCDFSPYIGYVAGVNTSSHAVTLWTDEAGLTDTQAGIWLGGGGLMSDGSGRIFVSTGNGVSPAPGPGGSPPSELGGSVIRLNVAAGGALSAADFFSPANAPTLDAADLDFGSGGPVGLPFGTANYPGLLVQAGKDGRVFLLNRNSLGGREQGPGGTDAAVSQAGPFGGQWGHPAAFGDTSTVGTGSSNDFVYYLGRNDTMRFLKFELNASGTPVLADVANTTAAFGYTSGSPVVTSNGTDPTSAVVWEVYSSGESGAGGLLEAFDAVPPASCASSAPCTMSPIWSTPIGTVTKFTIPATNNGIVYVGTRDGRVLAFSSPDKAPLTGATPVNFGPVPVGSTAPAQDVSVTASTSVTISAITTTPAPGGPFAAGTATLNGNPVTLPVTLTAGQTLTVPVTFTPTAPGGVTGSVQFATNSANFPAVPVSLTGQGTKPGLYATPGSASFGSVPDGTTMPVSVTITNGGTASETVSAVTPPAAPFSATGLPAAGTVITAGKSITATISYRPTATGANPGSFTITDADGTSLTVPLSGTGLAAVSQLTPTPTAVSFGSVPLGQQQTQTIDIVNTGNLPATVKTSSAPTVPFGAPDPVSAGLPVNPGYDIKVPITFTPASIGTATGSFQLTWTDASGTHTLTVPVTGTGAAPATGKAVPPPGGGWTLNGSAQMSGTSLILTAATNSQAGSAIYSVPEPSNGLTATFTAKIGGGTGADGMTLSLLNAAKAGPTALGGGGGDLGYGGLSGVAITLNTHKNPGYPSANFIGLATGTSGGGLAFAATATNVPALRTGSHAIGVGVSGQTVTVSVDGKQVLAHTLPASTIPSSVLIGFTGGTGSLNDQHAVTAASITAGGNPLPAPGGGWSYNAAARMSGPDTVLTPATGHLAGSVVYPAAVPTDGLQVTFNAQLSGGTGADGMTFALLNPAKSSATSVGGSGGDLGFGGLTGVAVTLDTYHDTGYPAGNFVGITAGLGTSGLAFQASALLIPQLRSGTHTVTVQVTSAGVLVVWLDGEQLLALPEPSLGPTSLLAFTGGTGGLTDMHVVRDVAISTG